MTAYIRDRGWNASKRIKDVGSGSKERPGRESLLKADRRREIDVVVVWRLDRWGPVGGRLDGDAPRADRAGRRLRVADRAPRPDDPVGPRHHPYYDLASHGHVKTIISRTRLRPRHTARLVAGRDVRAASSGFGPEGGTPPWRARNVRPVLRCRCSGPSPHRVRRASCSPRSTTACLMSAPQGGDLRKNRGGRCSRGPPRNKAIRPGQEVTMANRRGSPRVSDHPRAAIYARVSSKQQAEAATIASQIEALTTRVQADRLLLEAELSFVDDGYSGETLLRPALERLRDQAAAGAFIACMSILLIDSPAAIPTRCSWSRNSSDTASRSFSSTTTSADRLKRTCCSRFRG